MNFLSNLFSGVKNLFGGISQAAQGAGKSLIQGVSPIVGAGAKLGQSLIGSNPMSLFGNKGGPQPNISNTTTNRFTPTSGISYGGTSAFPTTTGAGMANIINPDSSPLKKSFMDDLFPGGKASGIAGLAIPAIGNMFGPKAPNVPDFSSLSSVQALQNFKPGQSVSPEYQQMLQNNVKQVRDQKVRELQQLYHNARPGTDYLTDTNYQRDLAKIDQDIQTNMSNDLARAEATFSQQEQDRLSQIAEMDIYSIMAQTGLDAQEASDFKDMFSNLGDTFLTNATRQPNNIEDLMALFRGSNGI